MKIKFELPPEDGVIRRYCIACQEPGCEKVRDQNDKVSYRCPACDHDDQRSIYFGNQSYWLNDNDEIWHESTGVFVREPGGRFLFYQRNEFPFTLTVPSGHVDLGEDALESAGRELREEVGLELTLSPVATDDIGTDSCSGGADGHRWHSFLAHIDSVKVVILNDEGDQPQWLTLDEALKIGVTPPIEYVITRHRNQLEAI